MPLLIKILFNQFQLSNHETPYLFLLLILVACGEQEKQSESVGGLARINGEGEAIVRIMKSVNHLHDSIINAGNIKLQLAIETNTVAKQRDQLMAIKGELDALSAVSKMLASELKNWKEKSNATTP